LGSYNESVDSIVNFKAAESHLKIAVALRYLFVLGYPLLVPALLFELPALPEAEEEELEGFAEFLRYMNTICLMFFEEPVDLSWLTDN